MPTCDQIAQYKKLIQQRISASPSRAQTAALTQTLTYLNHAAIRQHCASGASSNVPWRPTVGHSAQAPGRTVACDLRGRMQHPELCGGAGMKGLADLGRALGAKDKSACDALFDEAKKAHSKWVRFFRRKAYYDRAVRAAVGQSVSPEISAGAAKVDEQNKYWHDKFVELFSQYKAQCWTSGVAMAGLEALQQDVAGVGPPLPPGFTLTPTTSSGSLAVTPMQKMMLCRQSGGDWVVMAPGQPETGVCFNRGSAVTDGSVPSGFSCTWKEINWCLIGGLAVSLLVLGNLMGRD